MQCSKTPSCSETPYFTLYTFCFEMCSSSITVATVAVCDLLVSRMCSYQFLYYLGSYWCSEWAAAKWMIRVQISKNHARRERNLQLSRTAKARHASPMHDSPAKSCLRLRSRCRNGARSFLRRGRGFRRCSVPTFLPDSLGSSLVSSPKE